MESKLVKGLTIGLLLIRCIQENGVEVYHMEKVNIWLKMIFMMEIFAMEWNMEMENNYFKMGIGMLDNI